jgi:peptidase M28-like protein
VAAPANSSATRATETVRVLASEPRPAGSAAEARARAYCAERLRDAGFDVHEEPFEYSAFVGRWGTAIGGAVALAILVTAAAFGQAGSPIGALAMLTLGAAALGLTALRLAREGVLSFPAERRSGVNLVATRGELQPAVWLMAHLDSKSQPVPILARAGGITLLALTWIVAIAVAALQLVRSASSTAWLPIIVVAVIASIPVIATTVGSRSPGALDNATGVATVLAAAEGATSARVAVCLTSAEELGLAGARAWARARGRGGAIALNCDGVDDTGTTTCMYSGRRPDAVVSLVLAAGLRTGVPIRAHRLLPGVLTDGVALSDAGWPVVTLSKGGPRTLARIHTPHDRAENIAGAGIAEVARVMVELIEATTPNQG